MARKEQFLAELDEQLAELKSARATLSQNLVDNTNATVELKQRRADRLTKYTQTLLPDLQPASIQQLNRQLPDFVTPDQVARMLSEARTTYQTQLSNLLQTYDPKSLETIRAEISTALKAARLNLASVKVPFEALRSKTRITGLINSGYGTKQYRYRWFNLQYYRDWRDADEIVEKNGAKDWLEIRSQYNARADAIATFEEQVSGLATQLQQLEWSSSSYRQLNRALGNIQGIILDQLHVKLRARLDGTTLPQGMRDVEEMNAQLVALQEQSVRLQETQRKMLDQLAGLQQLWTQARQSRRRDVPDEFLSRLQQNRPVRGDPGSPTHVLYVQNYPDSGFFDGVLFGEMNSYFNQRESYERGTSSHSSYRDSTYGSAWSDRSGQS
jgi:hypothetical protein